jgi:hypothetical protein
LVYGRLQRLIEVVQAKFPNKVHLIPNLIASVLTSLAPMVLLYTCNGAQKLRHILVDRIDGAQDLDCMNHLCNVWVRGMEKTLSKYLNQMPQP